MSELENKNGVFKSDLMRTFRQLKESRAESVSYEYLFGPLADTTAVLKVLPEWKSKLVQ